jgi:hypothetical protein
VIAPVLEHELGRDLPRRATRDARKLLTRSPPVRTTVQRILAGLVRPGSH